MPMTASHRADTDAALVAPKHQRESDYRTCQTILDQGSKSFNTAAKILPKSIRPAVTAMYAFCRIADDLIDDGDDRETALSELKNRVDRLYTSAPFPNPVDRMFGQVIHEYGIPKEVLYGLLEGFDWDRQVKRYETIDDLLEYCARVASTVGVMMTLLMGPRDRETLARACDLGLAMQLTNIARDVGEDAASGRLYLPCTWLREAGIEPDDFLANPAFSEDIGAVTSKLLETAEHFYRLADEGISQLPRNSRVAIRAARLIYAEIGREISRNGLNSVEKRAYTTKGRKIWLCFRALGALFWRARTSEAAAERSVQFLVDAVPEKVHDTERST